jgi:tyrosyl-tRNA synthetase
MVSGFFEENQMKNIYDIFCERGFVQQISDELQVKELLGKDKITTYVGFDPTASSLHIGSLVPIMAMIHMQRCSHRPIALLGGGTGLIGDPSGKTEMRQFLSRDDINNNARCLQNQLSRFIDFKDGKAILLDNAEWLTSLNYIGFLRDIGRHFSVNKMLAAESYKIRLEKGLNFIEFNYMLLQAYDFLHLFRNYGCVLQMGGSDQWGNMLAGSDLIRRIEGKDAYSMTFPLITTSQGHKMGKTEKGTVWLDPNLTSPYEYYQFWINTEDADVGRFLALFTFLPMEEVAEVRNLSDSSLNMAKIILAFEATEICHGREAAVDAWRESARLFNAKPVDKAFIPSSTIPRKKEEIEAGADIAASATVIPSIEKSREELEKGIPAFRLACESGLAATSGDARRLIAQGGIYVNDKPIQRFDETINMSHVNANAEIYLRKGKKKHVVINVK